MCYSCDHTAMFIVQSIEYLPTSTIYISLVDVNGIYQATSLDMT